MMKVIFLDIDGVLNKKGRTINIDLLNILKYILEKTNAKIVISSSWRLGRMDKLLSTFEEHGIKERVIGTTSLFCDQNRESEIRDWVIRHENISNWVVIDDLNLKITSDKFVHIKSGITKENAANIISILNKKYVKKEYKKDMIYSLDYDSIEIDEFFYN